MSNAQKPKEKTQVSNVFSISSQDFAETGVPGVTRLINPEVARLKTTGKPEMAQQAAPPSGQPTSLIELGVDLELLFRMDRGEFRFSKFKSHCKTNIDSWQSDLFSKMVLNFKALGIETNFHEFSGKEHEFHREVFAIDPSTFVQVVRFESDPNLVSVLFSKQSLANSHAQLRAILEKPAEVSDYKIELAS